MKTMNCSSFLEETFPDIHIEKPLFYHAPNGIRFQLGDTDQAWDQEYMSRVYKRAIALFEALHSSRDHVMLIIHLKRAEKPHNMKKALHTLKRFLRKKSIGHSTEIMIDKQQDQERKSLRLLVTCQLADMKHESLLKAIANRDLQIRPFIEGDCYFINLEKKTIYHLYDDRKLDIVSNNEQSLDPLYKNYQDWILDYDTRSQYDRKCCL